MANFTLDLTGIKDQNLRRLLKTLQDQVQLTQGGTAAAAWKGSVNAGGYPLSGLAEATNDNDAVTLKQLRAATDARTLAAQFQAGGAAALNVTNLVGAGSPITFGTHATRLATPPVPGGFFYETDRQWLYQCPSVGTAAWWYAGGTFLSSAADLPTGLTDTDIGASYDQQDATYGNAVLVWAGTAWHCATAIFRGTLADINALNGGALDPWAASPSPLQGCYYEALDYDRVYLNDGTGWVDAPGQPTRGMMADFKADPGTGWALCDGSTVTMTTASGGTTSYTTLDYVTNGPVVRTGTTTPGSGTMATTGSDYAFTLAARYVRL